MTGDSEGKQKVEVTEAQAAGHIWCPLHPFIPYSSGDSDSRYRDVLGVLKVL